MRQHAHRASRRGGRAPASIAWVGDDRDGRATAPGFAALGSPATLHAANRSQRGALARKAIAWERAAGRRRMGHLPTSADAPYLGLKKLPPREILAPIARQPNSMPGIGQKVMRTFPKTSRKGSTAFPPFSTIPSDRRCAVSPKVGTTDRPSIVGSPSPR